MNLYEITFQTGGTVFVLAINESNALYKAYNKIIYKLEETPSEKGFKKWKQNVEKIEAIHTVKLDKDRFNVF